MKKKKRNNIKYSSIVIIVSLFLFVVILMRVAFLALSSTVDGVNLKELASKRTTRTEVLSAKRGNIYTADGDVLAQNVTSYKLIAYLDEKRTTNPKRPQHVVDKERTAKELAPILGIEEETILKYLSKEGLYQTEFGPKGKNLTELVKTKIENLNLPGLDFIESYQRYYPRGDFASYTIGYAKLKINEEEKEEELVGEMGIEKSFDTILKGEDGYRTYQKDLKGYQIPDTPVVEKDATQGKNIYLTLESNVQFFVEQALAEAESKYKFDWFHVTIADAKTGAILATATHPSFDPNIRNITNYLDVLIASPFEPGSVMKTFTYMAAMENGVYDGNETYKSGTFKTTDGTVIGDWYRAGWGVITLDKGYALSSNVGVINLIKNHMNSRMLRQYYKKLGFGKKTGIKLPNENPGNLEFKYETEIYNAGFGQGITTTPIQQIQALTPLTNDGMLLKPYIVSKIVDSSTDKVISENDRYEIERVASTMTIEKMLELMDDCVNGSGNTGAAFSIRSGELIGKTGTAQIARENGKGYLTGKTDIISSFSGIYPKSNPQYIIYAAVKRPSTGTQKPLATAVKDIVDDLSKYYGTENISTSELTIEKYILDSYLNKNTDDAKTILKSKNIKYNIIGKGNKIIKQYPNPNEEVTSQDIIYLITNDNNQTIPNVKGLSSKVAKNLLEKLGLKVTLEGVGYVSEQSLEAGMTITPNMEIKLTLKAKFTP